MNKIAFLSGHLDLTSDEFDINYLRPIRNAIISGHSFVVGDAKGADAMIQQYLSLVGQNNVTVYHMFDKPRNNYLNQFKMAGGFKSDDERDAAMTAASDYDIAWVREGREKSGTAKNLKRRKTKEE